MSADGTLIRAEKLRVGDILGIPRPQSLDFQAGGKSRWSLPQGTYNVEMTITIWGTITRLQHRTVDGILSEDMVDLLGTPVSSLQPEDYELFTIVEPGRPWRAQVGPPFLSWLQELSPTGPVLVESLPASEEVVIFKPDHVAALLAARGL